MGILRIIATELSGSDIVDAGNAFFNISKVINDYGVAIACLALFFLLFIGMGVLFLKTNKNMMDSIIKKANSADNTERKIVDHFLDTTTKDNDNNKDQSEQIISAIESLKDTISNMNVNGDYNHQEHSENDVHRDLVGAYIDVNMVFKDASRTCLNNLNCNRVAIYVFHNGNETSYGLPFFKMSCIHEWTPTGQCTMRGKSHTSLPLHFFNDFIEELWKSGEYVNDDIDRKNISPSISDFLGYEHIKAMYALAIKDENDTLAGFIVAEFDRPDSFCSNEERKEFVKNELFEMSRKISPLVAKKYIYNKDNDK